MIKPINARYTVNYDTIWTHDYLDLEQSLYFKAKTPVQKIIPQLENHLNKNGPKDLKANYQPAYMTSNFSRLYRRLAKSYKGWEVFYCEPGSREDYDSIIKRLDHEEKIKDRRALKQILRHRMLWKHDLYPAIQAVKINGAANCALIAKQLNSKFSQSDFGVVLKEWLPYLEGLNQNYQILMQQDLDLNTLNDKNAIWQNFFSNLQNIYICSQKLNVYNSKDSTIYTSNIYDVLTNRNKNAKGWRVEFLD